MNYITHRHFFVNLYQPIHWYLTRILMFLSEQWAPFSTMFAWELSTMWFIVTYSIFVTCLNFAGTGCDNTAIVTAVCSVCMTWYLAFKLSGRTAKAVKLCGELYRAIESWLTPHFEGIFMDFPTKSILILLGPWNSIMSFPSPTFVTCMFWKWPKF